LEVENRRVGDKGYLPSGFTYSPAIIKIFEVQKISFVKAPDILMHLPPNHHAGPRNCINIIRLARQRFLMSVERGRRMNWDD